MKSVMRKTTAWVLWALMLGLPPATLAGIADVRQQIEGSMLVTGYVYIEPDGRVGRLELDQSEKPPSAVKDLVEEAGPQWRFDPVMVDGIARKAKARMSLRVVAKKFDADRYQVTLRGAHFGQEALSPEELLETGAATIQPVKLRPPQYPALAAQMGARGTVYLILKIGQDGKVQEVLAEQVNLQALGREKQMEQMRGILAKSATSTARQWTFKPPTEGDAANATSWVARVPVDYSFAGDRNPGYGEWEAYVPGPRQEAPWNTEALAPGETPDAMVAGGIYPVGQGLRLRTPLQSG